MPDSQHVVYRGAKGHIHMVLYESGTEKWRYRDVSIAANALGSVPAGNPAVYVIPETSQHIAYCGVDGHIHKLHYDGVWHPKDLSAAAGATGFAVGGPAAFVIPGQSQHVVYRDADGEIHMVLYEDHTKSWRHVAVSDEAGPEAIGAPAAGDPAAFRTGGNQHIVYRGIDFSIHMLIYETGPKKWRHVDLNQRANATAHQSSSGDPAAFAIGSHQYAYYRGTEGRIHELKYEGAPWVHTDLGAAADAIDYGAAAGAGPAAFFIPGQSRHVVYRGFDSHIYMLIREGGHWRHKDLSKAANATGVLPAPGTPAAFFIPGLSQHVVYRDADGHIHMVLYEDHTESWRYVAVSAAAGPEAIGAPAAGDPAGYLFRVVENGGFWGDLWNGVKGAIKGAVDFFGRGVSGLWDLAGWLLTPIAFLVNLILTIPVVGGLLRILLDLVTGLVLGIVGLIIESVLCGVFGVCPVKRVRLCVVMFTADGNPLMPQSEFEKSLLQRTKQIFKDEANIEIISHFTIYKKAEGTRAMNPPCDFPFLVEEAVGVMGTQYQQAAMLSCSQWGAASVIGLGSPIYAFGVNDVRGDQNGCSLGLASNYVVFEASAADCTTHLAHEMGHACGLWHQDPDVNLMRKRCVNPGRDQLKQWQKMIVRGSKYATYW